MSWSVNRQDFKIDPLAEYMNRWIRYESTINNSPVSKVELFGYKDGDFLVTVRTNDKNYQLLVNAKADAGFNEHSLGDELSFMVRLKTNDKNKIILFLNSLANVDANLKLLIPRIAKNIDTQVVIPSLKDLSFLTAYKEISKGIDSVITKKQMEENLPQPLKEEPGKYVVTSEKISALPSDDRETAERLTDKALEKAKDFEIKHFGELAPKRWKKFAVSND